MSKERIIGIDLGTTNSCVAVMEGGDPIVIQNAEGSRTTPSIVAFAKSSEMLVGQVAKNQMITNPENTLSSVKRFIGRRFSELTESEMEMPYKIKQGGNDTVLIESQGNDYRAEEVSARVLQKMKKTAEDYIGAPVQKAVITVPAYFNDEQRQATKDAGKIAGLDVVRIINEPTAAALAYGLDKDKDGKSEIIAVYDLGGGTFDISILELDDNVFEVKSTNGDTHLGGDDFDKKIIDWLSQEFKKESGIDVSNDKMALQRLKEAAEKAKIELSNKDVVDINIPFITMDASGPRHLNMSLSRSKFDQLTSDLVEKTVSACKQAIKDAGVESSGVDKVILVGGSTRIPAVQKKVQEIFEKEPSKSVNPDEAVAVGAAIQAGVLAGDVQDVLLLDVTPLSLGIETLGGVMTKIITRNTTIPTKKSEVFSTATDNQPAVDIHVLQGEREMSKDNRTLGRFQLTEIPPAPRGIPQVQVTFEIDSNGIVQVSAKDLKTNKEQKITIQGSSSLTDSEIDKMVKDAESHAAEDQKLKEEAKSYNELDNVIYVTEKALQEAKDIKEEPRADIQREIDAAKEALASSDSERIKSAKVKLADITQKYSAELMASQNNPNAQQNPQQDANQNNQQQGNQQQSNSSNEKEGEEKVVDADFDEVESTDEK